MPMMFRFSVLIALVLAGTAAAERQLTRAELTDIMRASATCYQTADGGCYSAEFYEVEPDGSFAVVYAYWSGQDVIVVREAGYWTTDHLCVWPDARGASDAWRIDGGNPVVRFDLRTGVKLTSGEMDRLRTDLGAWRPDLYCYGFRSEDDGYTNLSSFFAKDLIDGGGGSVRFVPLTQGGVRLQ